MTESAPLFILQLYLSLVRRPLRARRVHCDFFKSVLLLQQCSWQKQKILPSKISDSAWQWRWLTLALTETVSDANSDTDPEWLWYWLWDADSEWPWYWRWVTLILTMIVTVSDTDTGGEWHWRWQWQRVTLTLIMTVSDIDADTGGEWQWHWWWHLYWFCSAPLEKSGSDYPRNNYRSKRRLLHPLPYYSLLYCTVIRLCGIIRYAVCGNIVN
jgi:hypothetical protein